jgi:hypothetical protein
MQHKAATNFWREYRALSREIRDRAAKQFHLPESEPQHPSLQLKVTDLLASFPSEKHGS